MRELLQACCEELGAQIARFPWTERDRYADWLAQTYYYVAHTTRLIAATASRFGLDERGEALHQRFATHLGEETRHEQLALRDLAALGATLGSYPERHLTRMFYECQYYKIERQSPMVHFGYLLPLEAVGPACGRRVADAIRAAFGEACVSFLQLHVDEDEAHLDKALRIVTSASPEERTLIAQNMEQTTFAYCALLRDLRLSPAASARA